MLKYVRVTQDDINRGVAYDPCFCPIARALKREFPRLCDADLRVEPTGISYKTSTGHTMAASLDDKSRNFVRNFDKGFVVRPTLIRLNLPFETLT